MYQLSNWNGTHRKYICSRCISHRIALGLGLNETIKIYLFSKIRFSQRLVIAGVRAYAFGMKPYFRVLGAYDHSQPSTV